MRLIEEHTGEHIYTVYPAVKFLVKFNAPLLQYTNRFVLETTYSIYKLIALVMTF